MSFFPLIRAAKAEAAAVGSDGGSWSRRQQLGGTWGWTWHETTSFHPGHLLSRPGYLDFCQTGCGRARVAHQPAMGRRRSLPGLYGSSDPFMPLNGSANGSTLL
ncbi:unnamed protein product [Prunus armeniaca]|uniref:Uncharacterized protein n=1 Tax=Prunus armeniaca TaxID=36596 RepID=A0A6J5X446_PRUAR|nr:unnamed protein product [Prunus armeniaca]